MKKKSTPASFKKFTKKSNAAIKEQFKQEKRKFKKEKEEFFDEKRRQAAARSQQSAPDNKRGNSRETGPVTRPSIPNTPSSALMPLNKYIAHAGICSRRDAAEMVKAGKIKVNDELITEPGHKVSPRDEVKINNKRIMPTKDLVYVLLNKPKDYITTTDDPQKRKTVVDLIKRSIPERVFPVGRLDRNTSGLLLLTNDGELAQQLMHPSHEIKKIYAVTLDKPLEKKDFDQILKGVTLNDGPATVDVLAYSDAKDKTQVGVEIHSGRNRIVRRIFEHLGYDVKGLDRVMFAGLTKKNIDRGKWRFLSEKEVRDLKYFGKGK